MSGEPQARAPRSRFYDGAIYASVLDRLTSGLRSVVVRQVGEAKRVLEVGSGTGSLAFELAKRSGEVVGAELSPSMVDHAEARRRAEGHDHVRFVLGDVRHSLRDVESGHFDRATMVLALHEMPTDARVPVLREVARLARELLVVDFAVPMPLNRAGLRNRTFEVLAGPEHYLAFRDFYARGGTPAIAEAAGLDVKYIRAIDRRSLAMWRVRG